MLINLDDYARTGIVAPVTF